MAPKNQSRSRRSANGHILTLDEIRSAKDVKEEIVEVPEWGGSVKVRGLKQGEVARVFEAVGGEDGQIVDLAAFQVQLVQKGAVAPEIPEDALGDLREKSWTAVARIAAVVMRLSGMEEGALEEAQKTFRS